MNTVERAYQLAPQCHTIDELRIALQREGHFQVEAYLTGTLRRDLKRLLKA
jgi:hypothetical protein